MTEIVMPRLSDTMEEGTILRWIKHDGEHVARGEELVEIETDKAAMVYESDADGVLQIVVGEGDTLPVGATIAHVGDRESPDDGGATAGAAETQPDAPGIGDQKPRVKASPLARRIARERGVDLSGLAGSGPGGRVVRADVEATATAQEGAAHPHAAGGPPSGGEQAVQAGASVSAPAEPETLAERVATAKGETTIVELTRTQQTIARRMAESKATIPDFSLTAEIDMEACVELRAELKRLVPEQAPTYNDMIVKACALALREHPHANGGYRDGRLQLHSRVNVGVAVATEDALVVPTVFDADIKSLGEIAREARALAERVRSGAITPPELGGGTFTVSNLGMYGVRGFTAIVNPPQAAILAVGALAPRAVVRDGQIVARHTLSVTLACDHRILYGADAARFLAHIRNLLQEPAALTL
ncbi:MAG TPA: dihydrolipoamide acetyltransferase family protein [Solirubrobacteraceae bacterium]|nr:dihydrolipoamide acetyltransferase family protein [Solirubrobacteraceae bacterium]